MKVRLRISCLARGGAHERSTQEVECHAGGIAFAKGETQVVIDGTSRATGITSPGEDYNILLAGQGGTRGLGGITVKIGTVIGVRAPTWEIDVGDEKWLVAVDWVVL